VNFLRTEIQQDNLEHVPNWFKFVGHVSTPSNRIVFIMVTVCWLGEHKLK